MSANATNERVHDELWSHLDWSFWGAGMADTFREPLADAMVAAITLEQREQANALITRWREHREFVGRDKYEEQKAEIELLGTKLATSRDMARKLRRAFKAMRELEAKTAQQRDEARGKALDEALETLATFIRLGSTDDPRRRGIAFAIGALEYLRNPRPAAEGVQ